MKIIALIMKLYFRTLKIEKERIIFTSFEGHYSDNPKYIAHALNDIDSSKEIVWLVKKKYMINVPHEFKKVDIDSLEAEKYRQTAAVIVDNVYGRQGYANHKESKNSIYDKIFMLTHNKKGQKVYTTWHGTPLKRMGRDQNGNEVCDFVCGNITMLGGNQFTLDVMNHLTFGKMKLELLGTPRNDILFSKENDREILCRKLGLPTNKKIVLFAPTFRNDGPDTSGRNVMRSGINQLDEIDFMRLFDTLSIKFGGDWVFVCRFHYHVEEMVKWEQLDNAYPGRIINGNEYDDMSEYLTCTDVLITDASSSMFDFSLTYRPCFLFFPDVEHYRNEERGFYMNIEELPYPLADNFEDLLKNIKNFSSDDYSKENKKLLEKIQSVDDENSSKRVAEYILEHWSG